MFETVGRSLSSTPSTSITNLSSTSKSALKPAISTPARTLYPRLRIVCAISRSNLFYKYSRQYPDYLMLAAYSGILQYMPYNP